MLRISENTLSSKSIFLTQSWNSLTLNAGLVRPVISVSYRTWSPAVVYLKCSIYPAFLAPCAWSILCVHQFARTYQCMRVLKIPHLFRRCRSEFLLTVIRWWFYCSHWRTSSNFTKLQLFRCQFILPRIGWLNIISFPMTRKLMCTWYLHFILRCL